MKLNMFRVSTYHLSPMCWTSLPRQFVLAHCVRPLNIQLFQKKKQRGVVFQNKTALSTPIWCSKGFDCINLFRKWKFRYFVHVIALASEVLTWAELSVIQLARLHILVRQVQMPRDGVKIHEHSGSVVAYPLECHALIKRLGSRAQDLPRFLTILFEGEDRTIVRRDPALRVGVSQLRAAFQWLLFNCWPWLDATRHLPITAEHFGADIEETIASFACGTLCRSRYFFVFDCPLNCINNQPPVSAVSSQVYVAMV